MFKFDFDIDEADDLDGFLDLEIPQLQPLPLDKSSLELEPSTEILIDHLVRANQLLHSNHPTPTDWHNWLLQ